MLSKKIKIYSQRSSKTSHFHVAKIKLKNVSTSLIAIIYIQKKLLDQHWILKKEYIIKSCIAFTHKILKKNEKKIDFRDWRNKKCFVHISNHEHKTKRGQNFKTNLIKPKWQWKFQGNLPSHNSEPIFVLRLFGFTYATVQRVSKKVLSSSSL